MKLKLLSTTLFFLLNSLSFSQNPGFQGKKFIVGTEIEGMPLVGAIISGEKLFDLNIRYGLKAEYVFLKNLSMGVKFQKSEDIIQLNNLSVSSYTPLQLALNSNLNSYRPTSFKSAANYSYNGYGMFVKIFNKEFGSIAPLGQYFILEYQFGNVRVHDDGRFYNNAQTEIHSLVVHNFILGGGLQNIFFNKLIVDLSINFGVNVPGAIAVKNYDEYISNGGNALIRQIEIKGFSDSFLSTRIGIGYLLF
ncbi:hypothetical protein DNU06_09485 [Putridiphycobacter roseus]|uniref:Outer membrane protein beta-barrel domain-containing protein n=2 Tax=Putridiphycobacter roseus TaxID=2219161 RepID=A0A2W1NCZ5_9FLAO|nr:hypothetical protein DNU06_09485 [Putridiphycobacter roseus]